MGNSKFCVHISRDTTHMLFYRQPETLNGLLQQIPMDSVACIYHATIWASFTDTILQITFIPDPPILESNALLFKIICSKIFARYIWFCKRKD